MLVDQDGEAWRVADGRVAPRTFGRQAFWFAWYTFYPHRGLVGGRWRRVTRSTARQTVFESPRRVCQARQGES